MDKDTSIDHNDSLTCRTFFILCNGIVDYMESFKELKIKRDAIQKTIDRAINTMLMSSIKMSDEFVKLSVLNNQDVSYLSNTLIMGLLHHEGLEGKVAYEKTVAKYDSPIERKIAKLLIKSNYFRKMNNKEINHITILRQLYNI